MGSKQTITNQLSQIPLGDTGGPGWDTAEDGREAMCPRARSRPSTTQARALCVAHLDFRNPQNCLTYGNEWFLWDMVGHYIYIYMVDVAYLP